MENRTIAEQLSRIAQSQRVLGALPRETRDAMLSAIAEELEKQGERITEANKKDLADAERLQLPAPLMKRLVCDQDKLTGICAGVREVASLDDPLGRVRERRLLDEGLLLERVDVPIGVIGMIFESRPDA